MQTEVLMRGEGLSKTFHQSQKHSVHAVREADIEIHAGETVGILGESGSGKSTLGQMLVGLQPASKGKIFYRNEEISYPYKGQVRQQIQILFQHPEVSFNPQLTMIKSLREPYMLYHKPFSREILLEDLYRFGLYAEHLDRLPGTLSGGELQRAALARILTLNPELIILDEPTSMLDAISQAQMIDILRTIQKEQNTAYLFITHNLALCKAFADRIYIMKDGVLSLVDDVENLRPEDYLSQVRN